MLKARKRMLRQLCYPRTNLAFPLLLPLAAVDCNSIESNLLQPLEARPPAPRSFQFRGFKVFFKKIKINKIPLEMVSVLLPYKEKGRNPAEVQDLRSTCYDNRRFGRIDCQ